MNVICLEEEAFQKLIGEVRKMVLEQNSSFFNGFEQARLRHLTMLRRLEPGRSRYSMVKKVAKNLGVSEELADRWVARHEEVGDLAYLGDEDLRSQ